MHIEQCKCGVTPEVMEVGPGYKGKNIVYYVICQGCDKATWYYTSIAQAVEAWNKMMAAKVTA